MMTRRKFFAAMAGVVGAIVALPKLVQATTDGKEIYLSRQDNLNNNLAVSENGVAIVWNNRKVKVEDGVLMLSRQGNYEDWDFGANYSPQIAIAIRPGYGAALEAWIFNNTTLAIETSQKRHWLLGTSADNFHLIPFKEGQ